MAQSDSSTTEPDLDSIINKLLSHNHSSGEHTTHCDSHTHMLILFIAPIVFKVVGQMREVFYLFMALRQCHNLLVSLMSHLHFIYIYAVYCEGMSPASACSSWSSEEIRPQ